MTSFSFFFFLILICLLFGLPRCLSSKESTCQCRKRRFNPWTGKKNLMGCSSWDCKRIGHDPATKQQQHLLFIWLCWILVSVGGIYFPYQGWNSGLFHWECGVLAPEAPGKSHQFPMYVPRYILHAYIYSLKATTTIKG